ncbi:MAG: prepilin peptidase [bacterium]|nr:prepilin peptidase [bacterium]
MATPLLIIYSALFGLVVGSFLNVVVHRLPRGTSIVFPRSACTFCGGPVAARDNIPVLSYLLLRGKCRRCSAPISIRYPLIELAASTFFALCAWRFGFSLETLAAVLFCSLLLCLALIDYDHFLLPDKLTLPGILAGLMLQPWLPRTSFADAALGILFGAGALILIVNFWYWLRNEEGMGLGDVNMLAMVGAFLGWQGAAVTLLVATVAGAMTGLLLIALRRLGASSRLPFGVFLSVGAVVALFFGDQIVDFYLGLL